MKTKTLFLVLITLTMLCTPFVGKVSAVNDISFQFTGHVVWVMDTNNILGGAISAGDIVTGTITFDLDHPPDSSGPHNAIYDYYSPPYGITVTINGLVFQSDPTAPDFSVGVSDDFPSTDPSRDHLSFFSLENVFAVLLEDLYDPPLPPEIIELMISYYINLQLNDDTCTAISSTDLPTEINLESWDQITGYGLRLHAYSEAWVHDGDHHYLPEYHIMAVIDTIVANAPPVEESEAYVTYVDDVITALPDDLFVRPPEDVADVKDDFIDLLSDALENIEEGEYGLAIDKLNRINELKYAELVDSVERQELNDLIDTLIGYLETFF